MCCNYLCIIIPALVGIICALLGYLLGKWCCGTKCQKKIDELNAQLLESKGIVARKTYKITELETALIKLKGEADDLPFDATAAEQFMGVKVLYNDLKVVEGIGPKIKELLERAGITSWKILSNTTVEKCQSVLDDAGEHFSMHVPTTWPKQSEMAYKGQWEELKKWQDELVGGKEV